MFLLTTISDQSFYVWFSYNIPYLYMFLFGTNFRPVGAFKKIRQKNFNLNVQSKGGGQRLFNNVKKMQSYSWCHQDSSSEMIQRGNLRVHGIFSMICIGLLAAFFLNDSPRRNPLKKMFLSENVIFRGLRPSVGHFGQQAPKSPVSQLQNGDNQ